MNGRTNVRVIEAAVSNYSGTALFDAKPGLTSAGRLTPKGQFQVPVVMLDELTQKGKIPVPNVIKMDIEGTEYTALTGANQLLADHHPLIFLATHGAQVHRQCSDLLTGLGYTFHALNERAVEDTDELIAECSPPI